MARQTDWQRLPFIPVRYFDSLVALAIDDREQRPALLQAADLTPERLAAPERLLRLPELEALVSLCQRHSGDPALALRLGAELNLSAHGALGFAGLSSATLEEAIGVAEAFFPLVTPLLSIEYRRGERSSRLRILPACPLSPGLHRFLLEAVLASLYAQGRYLLEGRIPDVRVRVPFPEYLELYRSRFPELRLETGVGPPCDVFFPTPVMDTALPLANAAAREQALRQCRRQMERLPHPRDLTRTVVSLLHQQGGRENAGAIAARLGLSERSLRRHLSARGPGFRELALRVRMDRARELLEQEGLSVSQVALRTGYTEVANFSRAWKRHFGFSPRQGQPSAGDSSAEAP